MKTLAEKRQEKLNAYGPQSDQKATANSTRVSY
jgi:hypothetical protein